MYIVLPYRVSKYKFILWGEIHKSNKRVVHVSALGQKFLLTGLVGHGRTSLSCPIRPLLSLTV